MAKKVYVGNLSYDASNAELEQLFAEHGTVESCQIITDQATGRSKGFGFVEMSNDDEARAAIEALDGKEMGGRTLKVNEARPKASHGGGGGGRGGYGGRGGGGGGGRDRGGRGRDRW